MVSPIATYQGQEPSQASPSWRIQRLTRLTRGAGCVPSRRRSANAPRPCSTRANRRPRWPGGWVARQTAVSWQARWRAGGAAALGSRGPSQRPKILDNQLPAIDAALRQGPAAHGFATTVWISEHVRVVIEQVTGVQLTPSVVRRLLRERLGWSVQRP
jgi:transposase